MNAKGGGPKGIRTTETRETENVNVKDKSANKGQRRTPQKAVQEWVCGIFTELSARASLTACGFSTFNWSKRSHKSWSTPPSGGAVEAAASFEPALLPPLLLLPSPAGGSGAKMGSLAGSELLAAPAAAAAASSEAEALVAASAAAFFS